MIGNLLALSIDFGKEVYAGFNRILGIIGIVLLSLLGIGIFTAIIRFATRVMKFSNEVRTAKALRKDKKNGDKR